MPPFLDRLRSELQTVLHPETECVRAERKGAKTTALHIRHGLVFERSRTIGRSQARAKDPGGGQRSRQELMVGKVPISEADPFG